jgi:hypothetical protein
MMLRALPFNLVVTNVPGPQVPLYLLDAQMVDNYGLVPLIDYLCLGIVLFSYNKQLCWGFTCDWDLLPDLHDFVNDIEAAFDELRDAAGLLGEAAKAAPAADAAAAPKAKGRRGPRVVRGNRAQSRA